VLGYHGNPTWRDMSEYVVHFCRTREALIAILASGIIEGRTPFGWTREFEKERDAARQRAENLRDYPTQKSVCLSEVPLDLLDRLVDRRGPSQRRDWHRITPFIDKVGTFPDGTVYRFEWEREWRVPQRLDLYAGHPAFLFAPTKDHTQLVTDLTAKGVAGTPHGIAPLLDPTWNESTLQAALTSHSL